MIDGIRAIFWLSDFENWKARTDLTFTTDVDVDNGNMVGKAYCDNTTYVHKGRFEHFKLTVKEIHKKGNISYLLQIDGSLHVNHCKGHNYGPFKYSNLVNQITNLCSELRLNPVHCVLRNCEIGINVELPFNVSAYIDKAILAHKGKSFQRYFPDKRGRSLGVQCVHAEYVVKAYDKGLQHLLTRDLLRFEVRFVKMTLLKKKYGIFTLQDLMNKNKVYKLFALIEKAWNDILIYEPDINPDIPSLTKSDRDLLLIGKNVNEWEKMKGNNVRTFNKKRTRFKSLMKRHGQNTQSAIVGFMKKEWELLFEE